MFSPFGKDIIEERFTSNITTLFKVKPNPNKKTRPKKQVSEKYIKKS